MIIQIFLFFIVCVVSACSNNSSDNKEQYQPTQPSKRTTSLKGNRMTIDYQIIIGKELTPKETSSIQLVVDKVFDEINRIYNKWNPDSEISKLNKMKGKVIANISPQLEQLLKKIDEIYLLSQGRFDPTIEPLQQLWKKKLELASIPSAEEINALLPTIGWDKIHFGKGLFSKDHDLTSLDLGGIAKGFCVDLLVERLNEAGYPNVYVEWGGEIRASGFHPDQRPWNIFISRLGSPSLDDAIAVLPLKEQAIATSGDYLQNWTVSIPDQQQSTTYFHIINPNTCQPLCIRSNSVASASVLAPTCVLADGLATAAMMFSTVSEARAWAKDLQKKDTSLRFWIVSREQCE